MKNLDYLDNLIQKLSDNGVLLSVAVAGGGASAITDLLTRSGCSKFLHDFQVPYGKAAFDDLAGHLMDLDYKYVTSEAAQRLARGMLNRQKNQTQAEGLIRMAVGVTAKLTSGPGERAGRTHSVHMSALYVLPHHGKPTPVQVNSMRDFIPQGKTRMSQEQETSDEILKFLSHLSNEMLIISKAAQAVSEKS